MPYITIRAFRSRGVYASIPAFRDYVLAGVRGFAEDEVISRCLLRVANWTRTVYFWPDLTMDAKGIHVEILPTGPGAPLWHRLSQGVPAKVIKVKNRATRSGYGKYKPAMKMYRYRPKTAPGNVYGMAGGRTGRPFYARKVRRGPIAPRRFEMHIGKEVNRLYRPYMENLVRRAITHARREGG